jgi:RNA polymerase sigma factor (sigma-70 family)
MATDSDAVDSLDMQSLQAGEELALNPLMARHREKVFHYLIRLLHDEAEALDLAQETFVRIFLNRDKFNLKHRFTSWLYAIATNLARDRMRWLSRRHNISIDAPASLGSELTLADSLPDNKPLPGEQLQQNERIQELKNALADIPEELRTPLILVEYENLSQAEIAEILRCSPKSVENRLYRARRLLREKLKHLMHDVSAR